ncbi:MAG: sorbosone dehydrogenase family protein, partial [Moraxellaceae bacterium]
MWTSFFLRQAAFVAISLFSSVSLASDALPEGAGMGPKPTLPKPDTSLIPTINIAPEKGWSKGATPIA